MAKISKAQRTGRLQDAQVGDLLAPMRTVRDGPDKWTGMLRGVTKVTPKRVFLNSTQLDKDTGREVGGVGSSHYIIAAPEMVAEFNRKQAEREAEHRERAAFQGRADYGHASAIVFRLADMTIDDHPLDRLTPEEWRALREKICGPMEAE